MHIKWQFSPDLPRKPPVTAEMKMEEFQTMMEDQEEFEGESILEDFLNISKIKTLFKLWFLKNPFFACLDPVLDFQDLCALY